MSSKHEEKQSKEGRRFLYAKFQRSAEIPFIILFLIKHRIVKNEKSARRLIIFVILAAFLLSVYFFLDCTQGPIFIDKLNR